MKEKLKKLWENPQLLLAIGLPLMIAGFVTDGLWPWQLPACMVGSYLCTRSLIHW